MPYSSAPSGKNFPAQLNLDREHMFPIIIPSIHPAAIGFLSCFFDKKTPYTSFIGEYGVHKKDASEIVIACVHHIFQKISIVMLDKRRASYDRSFLYSIAR